MAGAGSNPGVRQHTRRVGRGVGEHMKLGSHMTDEQRARISAGMTGLKASPETRAKMSATRTGHAFWGEEHHTTETRAKLSAALMGHPVSIKTRIKMSAAQWRGGPRVSSRRGKAKRRVLGFIPLNSWFVGCEGHHINKSDVIYLPRKLHRSIWHNHWPRQGMAEINALAGAFLTE